MSLLSGWSENESESISDITSSTVQLNPSMGGHFYENETFYKAFYERIDFGAC